jgi:hypothetical protein
MRRTIAMRTESIADADERKVVFVVKKMWYCCAEVVRMFILYG